MKANKHPTHWPLGQEPPKLLPFRVFLSKFHPYGAGVHRQFKVSDLRFRLGHPPPPEFATAGLRQEFATSGLGRGEKHREARKGQEKPGKAKRGQERPGEAKSSIYGSDLGRRPRGI